MTTLAAWRRLYRKAGPGAVRAKHRRHKRLQALRFLRSTTAQLAFDDLYPLTKESPLFPSP